ncbi:Gag-pol polyprotein [Operophtera brumata]|uniref:Gag-pol polyprotein n=1 Tax=Operophtera brumata TaxID=104452 RepID=A0A0L7L024_OPEBR|nr:Gag-pol polyprotein [Operophtera brumata]
MIPLGTCFEGHAVPPGPGWRAEVAIVGTEPLDIIIDLCFPEKPENTDFDVLVKLVEVHLAPKRGRGRAGQQRSAHADGAAGSSGQQRSTCHRCGQPHRKENCPFTKVECFVCGNRGHVAKVCRFRKSGSVHQVDSEEDYDDLTSSGDEGDQVYQLSDNEEDNKWIMKVAINGKQLSMEGDTGAGMSIINRSMYYKYFSNIELTQRKSYLRMYNGQKILPKGEFKCSVQYNNKVVHNLRLVVIDNDDSNALFGRKWMRAFGVKFPSAIETKDSIAYVDNSKFNKSMAMDQVLNKFPEVFSTSIASSNGAAESTVKIIKSCLKKAMIEREDLQLALDKFLLYYRSTPHSLTGKTPSQLLLGRNIRTHYDVIRPNIEDRVRERQNIMRQQCNNKVRNFEVGDEVQFKQFRNNKTFWEKGVIVKRSGPVSYQVRHNNKVFRKHVDHIISRSTTSTTQKPVSEKRNIDYDISDFNIAPYSYPFNVDEGANDVGNRLEANDIVDPVSSNIPTNIPHGNRLAVEEQIEPPEAGSDFISARANDSGRMKTENLESSTIRAIVNR